MIRRNGHTGAGARVLQLNFPGGRTESVIAKQIMQHGVTREAGGLLVLRTTTDIQNGAQLTFKADAHTDAPTKFVLARPPCEHVPSARLRFLHVPSA